MHPNGAGIEDPLCIQIFKLSLFAVLSNSIKVKVTGHVFLGMAFTQQNSIKSADGPYHFEALSYYTSLITGIFTAGYK